MRSKGKKRILPNEKMILAILNSDPDVAETILSFYERYIQQMATNPPYSSDCSQGSRYYDEDLAQELRIALSQSLPSVRMALLKNHFSKRLM